MDLSVRLIKYAGLVEKYFNLIGEIIGSGIESIYSLNQISAPDSETPRSNLTLWLGRTIRLGFAVVGSLIKGGFGILGGIGGGLIKFFGGIFILNKNLLLAGLWDIFSPMFGAFIVVGGNFAALLQSIFLPFLFSEPERFPTFDEQKILYQVFKDSLNYRPIRIVEGQTGIFDFNERPFVLGNTIYMKKQKVTDSLLVHEATHIWQYQHIGVRYASDALAAQWFVPDAYNWNKEIVERGKNDWSDFNKEAQAKFLQDLWGKGKLMDRGGTIRQNKKGSFYNADGESTFGYFSIVKRNLTKIATKAVRTIRK